MRADRVEQQALISVHEHQHLAAAVQEINAARDASKPAGKGRPDANAQPTHLEMTNPFTTKGGTDPIMAKSSQPEVRRPTVDAARNPNVASVDSSLSPAADIQNQNSQELFGAASLHQSQVSQLKRRQPTRSDFDPSRGPELELIRRGNVSSISLE